MTNLDLCLSPEEVRRIATFVAEEVRRQGDGPRDVGYMMDAWMDAIVQQRAGVGLTVGLIEGWARKIDPSANSYGMRTGPIWIGTKERTATGLIERMYLWAEAVKDEAFTPDFASDNPPPAGVTGSDLAYKAFEEIHPFYDGNGRTGKIIYNWLNGTLLDPVWPFNWWGVSNP